MSDLRLRMAAPKAQLQPGQQLWLNMATVWVDPHGQQWMREPPGQPRIPVVWGQDPIHLRSVVCSPCWGFPLYETRTERKMLAFITIGEPCPVLMERGDDIQLRSIPWGRLHGPA
jgi:hypothetical protein